MFSSPSPLFCLGYGLSYTTFEYSDLRIDNGIDGGAGAVEVSCRVRNTGRRAGAEVVQLYVRDLVSSVTTPVRALKGFDKIFLEPGQEREVRLRVPASDLMLWNRDMEPGEFEVYVGASSEDVRLKGRFAVK